MEDWIRATLDWLDGHCFYREIPEIESALKEHFSIQYLEWDYIAERLKTRKLNCLIPLVRLPVLKSVAVWIYRRFGGVVILATRREYPIAATRANAE